MNKKVLLATFRAKTSREKFNRLEVLCPLGVHEVSGKRIRRKKIWIRMGIVFSLIGLLGGISLIGLAFYFIPLWIGLPTGIPLFISSSLVLVYLLYLFGGKTEEEIRREQDEEQANSLIKGGNSLLEKYQLEKALTYFEEALKLIPDNEEALKGREQAIQKLRASQKILESLYQFRVNVPVSLQRLAEITDLSKEETNEIIKKLLRDQPTLGEYLELEQVFIRKIAAKDVQHTCHSCGSLLKKGIDVCPDCGSTVLRCAVCKLPISFGEEVGMCSLCETKGHLVHLQEWLKTNGKCPTCLQEIPLEGIVILEPFEK